MDIRTISHKIIDFIFKYSLHISSILLVALSVIDISNLNNSKVSIWGLIDFPIGKIIYLVVVVGTIIFGVFSIQNAHSVTVLEKDNEEQAGKIIDLENGLTDAIKEMHELFNSYLMLLVKNLNFTHSERISVYKIFDNSFVLIGRSSNNPNLKARGRSNYPLQDGFIGKAWAEGEYYVNDLPDINARNGDTYYQRVNSICPIPREVIRGMNMLSRTFYIYRINGYDSQPKAIIVIESLNHNAFTKEEVVDKLNGVKQPLVMFVEKNNGINLQPTNIIGL
jgi:hypothetical protein